MTLPLTDPHVARIESLVIRTPIIEQKGQARIVGLPCRYRVLPTIDKLGMSKGASDCVEGGAGVECGVRGGLGLNDGPIVFQSHSGPASTSREA